jgi:hypothetical protein
MIDENRHWNGKTNQKSRSREDTGREEQKACYRRSQRDMRDMRYLQPEEQKTTDSQEQEKIEKKVAEKKNEKTNPGIFTSDTRYFGRSGRTSRACRTQVTGSLSSRAVRTCQRKKRFEQRATSRKRINEPEAHEIALSKGCGQ